MAESQAGLRRRSAFFQVSAAKIETLVETFNFQLSRSCSRSTKLKQVWLYFRLIATLATPKLLALGDINLDFYAGVIRITL